MTVARSSLNKIGPDDDVGDPGFILERQEHEALRGAGTLTCDDGPGDTHPASRAAAGQIARAQHAAQCELAAAERHRVGADGQARAGIIRAHALDWRHRPQRRRRWLLIDTLETLEHLAWRANRPLDLP